MATLRGNLFADSATPGEGERFDTLLTRSDVVIERIVSSAGTAPRAYLQAHDEWVVLLRGTALMEIAGEAVELEAGDYVYLSAGVEHSVESTSEGALWLALHLHEQRPDRARARRRPR